MDSAKGWAAAVVPQSAGTRIDALTRKKGLQGNKVHILVINSLVQILPGKKK